jgi:hypothetical protein
MLTTSNVLSSASMRAARAGRSTTPLTTRRAELPWCEKFVAFAAMRIEKLGQGRDEGGAIFFFAQLDPQHDLVISTRAKQGDSGGVRPPAGQPLQHRHKDLPDIGIPIVPGFIEEARYSAHVKSLRNSVY